MFFWIKGEIDGITTKKPELPEFAPEKKGQFKTPMPRSNFGEKSFADRSEKDSVFSLSTKTQVVEAGNQLKSPIVRRTIHHNI